MQRHFLYIIGFILALIVFPAKAQITAPYAGYSDIAVYTPIDGKTDSLFFFRPDSDSTFILVDTLNYKGYNILWEEYDPPAYLPMAETSIKLSVEPAPLAKGYRLTLSNATDTIIARCWVIKYTFGCTIIDKDANDTLLTSAYAGACDKYGPIQVSVYSDSIKYYKPESDSIFPYEFKYITPPAWQNEKNITSAGNVVQRGYIESNLKFYIENAYYEDMWYTITVTDIVGTEESDKVFVKSINPKADFTQNYIPLDDTAFYPDRDSNYYFFYGSKSSYELISAPALYFFKNLSKNADSFIWKFGDSTSYNSPADSILKYYEVWGDFKVSLTAIHTVEWSGKQCTNIKAPDDVISISAPILKAPNVYSTAGDIPAWRFYDASITDFEITIFSRYGIKVHHFEGNIRDWNGWDGKINNSQNTVSTGVYYYVVRTILSIPNINPKVKNPPKSGTEDNSDSGKGVNGPAPNEYRGFIHVFSNE